MIARYIRECFVLGAFMVRLILICVLGVGAFALTLELFSRHAGLPRSAAASSTRAAAQPQETLAKPADDAAPLASATNPPAAIAPPPAPEQSQPQGEPDAVPDADNGEPENAKMLAQRDRGTERSARSR